MSSKRRLRRGACERKQTFASETAAQDAIYAARRHGMYGMAPYHCRFGDHWHNGHPPAHVRQAMAAKRKNREKAA